MSFERISLLLKSSRFVYIGLFLFLLNFVLLLVLVLPRKQSIADLQSDYSRLRSQIAEDQTEIQVLSRRLEALQKAQKDLDVIYNQVLSQKKVGVTAIRQELQDLAGDLGVDRRGVDYNYFVLPEYGLRHFTLSVPVEGAYRDIRQFINDIERSEYFLILERVDLSAERGPQGGDSLVLNFQLSTYLTDEEAREERNATRSVSQP
jgi:Tfp pilus assembly protein PilO